jgi:hypothetical protein
MGKAKFENRNTKLEMRNAKCAQRAWDDRVGLASYVWVAEKRKEKSRFLALLGMTITGVFSRRAPFETLFEARGKQGKRDDKYFYLRNLSESRWKAQSWLSCELLGKAAAELPHSMSWHFCGGR